MRRSDENGELIRQLAAAAGDEFLNVDHFHRQGTRLGPARPVRMMRDVVVERVVDGDVAARSGERRTCRIGGFSYPHTDTEMAILGQRLARGRRAHSSSQAREIDRAPGGIGDLPRDQSDHVVIRPERPSAEVVVLLRHLDPTVASEADGQVVRISGIHRVVLVLCRVSREICAVVPLEQANDGFGDPFLFHLHPPERRPGRVQLRDLEHVLERVRVQFLRHESVEQERLEKGATLAERKAGACGSAVDLCLVVVVSDLGEDWMWLVRRRLRSFLHAQVYTQARTHVLAVCLSSTR